ncbi:Pimeloyl-ACP methyl ester carboxylesterase [Neorhodopirellula lusitana]|uniref:Pimeloyl-ACP methyl ester carboxylesterase n=1 Tax=Neorhodopirellula lusitana TaxID=445327 RepID=A0ABY1Q0F5_9BACT|nr:alpha/beta hydrolase [Neorhodopirellula lusitana]SMP55577.1 Pimeloyl-ACP methyl ester carboxylesterase [Neorhodopirellula lusitana]
MAIESSPPLILLSGLAADSRIFGPQKLAFPRLQCLPWLSPTRGESLDRYAQRMAASLGDGPCVIGGASFGGIVSLHMARYLNVQAVVLIGSVKSPAELPLYARCARPFRFLIPLIPVRLMQILARPFTQSGIRRLAPFTHGLACQFCDADPSVFKWSLARILDWSSSPAVLCPVFHIHGDRDWTLPVRHTSPNVVVTGGGHVLTLTHAKEVNSFLDAILAKLAK